MSKKRGYNYENVKEFCEKYDCKLVSTKDEIDLKPAEFTIESSCGHESTVSFNLLFKCKRGIYCANCFNDMDEAKCFSCGEMFEHSETSFLYCSKKCSRSQKISEEHKQKTRNSYYEKFGYYNEDGSLMNNEEVKQLRLKKREIQRRNDGAEEKKIYTYEMIKEIYEKEGCKLLTTEEDFNKDKLSRIFKIEGKCGCIIEQSDFKTFLYKKVGFNCNICTNKNTSINAKINSKIDGVSTKFIIEKKGVDLIRKICENKFIIIKTREACEADILVKPIDNDEDIWLPIQLKVTSKKNKRNNMDHYAFNIGAKNYKDMLLLLVCIEDSKFWLFESDDINIQSLQKITICNKSKYDYAYVENLNEKLTYWYDKNVYNIPFEKGNMPQNKNAQLEYKYVKLRENKIDFLNFTNNEIDGLVYDFKIDELKIQEKVCTQKKNSHIAAIGKNGGWINDGIKRKQTHIPYLINDNDFYWFNLPDENTFYVVPEIELIDRGFITVDDIKGKTSIGVGSNEYWLHSYKFYYNTINEEDNKEKLMILLELD